MSDDYFIKSIDIKKCKFIENLHITLDGTTRQHLMFTGKNGSGKTTVLNAIDDMLNKLIDNGFANIKQAKEVIETYTNLISTREVNINKFIESKKDKEQELSSQDIDESKKAKIKSILESYAQNIQNYKIDIEDYTKRLANSRKTLEELTNVNLAFTGENKVYSEIIEGKFILAFFGAKRKNEPIVSDAIKNITINKKNHTATDNLHKEFISYMVRLRTTLLNERFDGDKSKALLIEKWFENFENTLKKLFHQDDLKLKYIDDELNFKIEYGNKEFGLNELSDGYSSLIAILTELILRMEAHGVNVYDMQGVVLIDEIETHLHVALQKEVLPFLTDFFPKIQFIVTTHSPFVLSSLSNAVVYDLEKDMQIEDLSAYSYDALVESYFDSDKYSQELKEKIQEYEKLSKKESLSQDEQEDLKTLSNFFDDVPKFLADELAVKVNEIKLNKLYED